MSWYRWKPYIPVAVQRAQAVRKMEKLRKKGIDIKPVEIQGRKIAHSFWGKAWCDHLESFSDYQNRLPRGRRYVRNGSVCHLSMDKGKIKAMVSGTELYEVEINIRMLPKKSWKALKKRCAGQIGSLLELLQGKLSGNVMTIVTDRNEGLFPLPGEIEMHCSCPDWAVMCKHVAATLYGVGARLDEHPEMLFLLRGVDHEELISAEASVVGAGTDSKRRRIAEDALEEVFGIDLSDDEAPAPPAKARIAKHHKAKPALAVKKSSGKTNPSSRVRRSKKATGASQKTSSPGRKAVSGKAVSTLRARFCMSQSQFARLLGVSVPTISNWENNPGQLQLRKRTLEAWQAVKRLNKRQAWKKMEEM